MLYPAKQCLPVNIFKSCITSTLQYPCGDYRTLNGLLRAGEHSALAEAGIDRIAQALYIGDMTKKTTPILTEPELTRLEQQVDTMLELIDRLTKENRSLRSQQESMATERAGMLEKHDQVRNRVDAIVTRLKSLETGA